MTDDILHTVKESMAGVHMRTPVADIVAGGRTRRRRRLSGLTAAGALAVTGLTAGALAISGSGAAPPVRAGGNAGSAGGNVQLAAFRVVSNPNGTATVTLVKGPGINPDSLGRALSGAGIPAIIRVGSFCRSHGNSPQRDGVITSERRSDGSVILVINPKAMPSGTQLSIGFKPESVPGTKDRIRFTLVPAGARLTCDSFG
jgi:hypothetical protein